VQRWIDLEGLANLRDLGGLPTESGERIQPRRLLRSDNLQTLTERDIEALLDIGLSDVIDLRGMTLMPGLITSHLHPDFYKFDIFAGEKPGKELPPGVMMAIGVRTCRVLLESGFTGYVGAACAHDIDVQLKMAIAQGIIPGPRIRACGHHLGTTGDMNNRSRWCSEARRAAARACRSSCPRSIERSLF